MWASIVAFISSVLLCSVKFGVVYPITIRAQNYNFLEAILFGLGSGTLGISVFIWAGEWLNKWIDKLTERLRKNKPRKKKKLFTPAKRRMVRIKNRYGLAGIAFLSPVLLSIPVGVFLALRFYGNPKRIFLFMISGVFFWSIILALLNEGVRFFI
jgi:hypothetical protein